MRTWDYYMNPDSGRFWLLPLWAKLLPAVLMGSLLGAACFYAGRVLR